MTPPVIARFVLLALASACTAPREPMAASHDSAGVAILTSEAPLDPDTLRLSPVWVIGDADGSRPDAPVSVSDLATTTGGRIVVADAGRLEVIAWDTTGRELWRVGREGDGPGEFRGALSLAARGDTVYAHDFVTRRLTKISPEGRLLGVMQLDLDHPNLELLGARDDGDLLYTSRHLLGPTEGLNRDSVVVLRIAPDGSVRGSAGHGRFRNVEFFMGAFGPNIHDEALGPSGAMAVLGTDLLQTDGAAAEVRRRGLDGEVEQLVRWSQAVQPVTDRDREQFLAAERASVPDEFRARLFEERAPRVIWPATLPLTGHLVAAPRVGILVEQFCPQWVSHCTWLRFDAEGHWQQVLDLPVHATQAAAVGDLLVTVGSNALGVEQVSAWRLPGGGADPAADRSAP